MTFLDRETTRKAQAARRSSKDRKGRPNGKFATPDRPGTNLSYSVTGKPEGQPLTDMQRALAEANLPDDLKPRARKRKPRKAPQGKRKPRKPQSINVTVHPSVNGPTNATTGKPGPGAGGAAAAIRAMAARVQDQSAGRKITGA